MMKKKKLLILLFSATFIIFFIQPRGQKNTEYSEYIKLFDKAEALFNGNADEHTDSIALNYYTLITNKVSLSAATAMSLYNCHERIGILQQGLGYTSKQSLQQFYSALDIYRNYHLPDSITFRLLLSAGNAHYADGLFDSSEFYFSKAEKIIEKYPAEGKAEDLYNSLGALFSESGDYKQSGIYFSKALEITKKTRPDVQEAIFAMSMNVASAVRLSGYDDSAIHLYKKLLKPGFFSTPLLNNLGRIYLNKKIPDSALYFLKQIQHPEGSYAIAYNNSLALAQMQKNDTALAAKYLNAAASIFYSDKEHAKSNYYGSTCKYYGDLKLMQHQLNEALQFYQQAIIQYDYPFNDSNPFLNPGNFIGEFASYDLFEALLAKANCFAELYNEDHLQRNFDAAKNTYEAAFALADYIKKSIDNDDARLFIADKVFDGYRKAVDFIMNKENGRDTLIPLALKWISKSRASSLAISLKENTIKQYAGLPDSLLQKEKNLKLNLSRLKLQMEQTIDSNGRSNFLSAINGVELQLQQVMNAYKGFPTYYAQKFAADNFDIKNAQKKIPDNTAIICYFRGEYFLMSFVIKREQIIYHHFASDSLLDTHLERFAGSLAQNEPGKKYEADYSARYLYDFLVKPLEPYIGNRNSLVIIPDQQLINIPFEAFRMPQEKYLVEKYAVTYQYALPFIGLNTNRASEQNVLAIAPFNNNKNVGLSFGALPASAREISGFDKNAQLLNRNATKSNFLVKAVSASLIHLATHAAVDFNEPENSYIAFYPFNKEDSSYKLFAHELYNLQLPSTHLVFLSACETGTGKVSQSEGALSLSRAFAYAGCPNIVTSLWKAEDKSTAYISEKFYEYLNKGDTYTSALQQAKKDLLNDASMSQFHAAQYWCHLIFIGDIQPEKPFAPLWLIIVGSLFAAVIIYLFAKKKKNLAGRQ